MGTKKRHPRLGTSVERWLDAEGTGETIMASIVPAADHSGTVLEDRRVRFISALKQSFEPYAATIGSAFVFGSVASGADTDDSDVDLMVIGDDLNYSDLYTATQSAERKLRRRVNALFLSPEDWRRKVADKESVFGKVLRAPKLFIIGSEKDLRSWASQSSTIS